MSIPSRSLLDTSSLSSEQIHSLFRMAELFQRRFDETGVFLDPSPAKPKKVASFLFFEPSTRTRMSFQMAAYRLGLEVTAMDSVSNTSVTKGETLVDTVLNIAAMEPDLLVIRFGESPELEALISNMPMPVISAGTSAKAHPTQALLDAFTILQERGNVVGERVLIVGDIRYSRVARSNFDVLSKLGAEIAICGPPSLLPPREEFPHVRHFGSIEEGLEWATVCMALRIQLERHIASEAKSRSLTDYHEIYGVNSRRLQSWRSDGILLHPGPINHGVEISSEVLQDPRCRVLAQVTNGVLIRAAIISNILGLQEQ